MDLWDWWLMSNHVHWLVLPRTSQALARLFRSGAHGEYARHRHRPRSVPQSRLDTLHVMSVARLNNPRTIGVAEYSAKRTL